MAHVTSVETFRLKRESHELFIGTTLCSESGSNATRQDMKVITCLSKQSMCPQGSRHASNRIAYRMVHCSGVEIYLKTVKLVDIKHIKWLLSPPHSLVSAWALAHLESLLTSLSRPQLRPR
jgi:hypothetical protein